MEWQQLLGFYQVAKLGSFTKAAEATFRTQSALSQQVKALEEELDARLLERLGKRRLKLTPAGEKLLAFAQGLLAQWDRLQDELRHLQGHPQGPLRLAAPFTTLYHLLPETLLAYLRQYPQVELTLLDRSQAAVFALVKDGDVDFGLALESLVPKDLAARRWQPVDTGPADPFGPSPDPGASASPGGRSPDYPLIVPPRGLESRPPAPPGRALPETGAGLSHHHGIIQRGIERPLRGNGPGPCLRHPGPGPVRRPAATWPLFPCNHYFKPDHLALVLRRDKALTPYKEAFINLLFGDTMPSPVN